ncbi:hypothetical protein N9L68_07900 [bacterium]|nr:hypothetical protein [bacterium]
MKRCPRVKLGQAKRAALPSATLDASPQEKVWGAEAVWPGPHQRSHRERTPMLPGEGEGQADGHPSESGSQPPVGSQNALEGGSQESSQQTASAGIEGGQRAPRRNSAGSVPINHLPERSKCWRTSGGAVRRTQIKYREVVLEHFVKGGLWMELQYTPQVVPGPTMTFSPKGMGRRFGTLVAATLETFEICPQRLLEEVRCNLDRDLTLDVRIASSLLRLLPPLIIRNDWKYIEQERNRQVRWARRPRVEPTEQL